MAEDEDQRAAEVGEGVLDAAQHERVDGRVAGDAHDEEVAQAGVEDHVGGHPRIGAADDHRPRLLTGGEFARRSVPWPSFSLRSAAKRAFPASSRSSASSPLRGVAELLI